MTLTEQKNEIRKKMKQLRAELTCDHIAEIDAGIFDRLNHIPEISNLISRGSTVMSYMSFRNEFPTHTLNKKIIDSGCRLVLPLTDAEMKIRTYYVHSFDELKKSKMGILEPDPDHSEECAPDAPDIILLPGLAFDRSGNRLGFGAGCYDRFLPRKRNDSLLIALAYSFQLVDEIPVNEHDIPCCCIITEDSFIDLRN